MKVIFLKKMLKLGISSSIRKNGKKQSIFGIPTVGSCTRLLGEHVQKSFKKVDRTDCEIITFEVERKVSFSCARQGQ
jgi:hypothetical protein